MWETKVQLPVEKDFSLLDKVWKIENGDVGRRSLYLSYVKRALYQFSYIFVIVFI